MKKGELEQLPAHRMNKIIYPGNENEWKAKLEIFLTQPVPEAAERVQKKFDKTHYEPAPEGWLTNRGLDRTIDADRETTKRIAERYRQSNPEWFKTYLIPAKRPYEHYHPDLISIVKKELKKREPAPAGWLTIGEIATDLQTSHKTIERLGERQRSENPGWFKWYISSNTQFHEHYHPNLVAFIREAMLTREKPPEGWITNRGLADKLKVAKKTTSRIADKSRKSKPEWFKIYLDKADKPAEHYNPDLVALIEKEITGREKAPKGWMNQRETAALLGTTPRTIENLAKKLAVGHDDWKNPYLDSMNRKFEHYHPDLIQEIKKSVDKMKPAPDGWVTINQLGSDIGAAPKTILKLVAPYKDSPEYKHYFEDYAVGSGQVYEHVNPDLVQIIKNKLGK